MKLKGDNGFEKEEETNRWRRIRRRTERKGE
jgi:hypothetical protein